MPQLAQLPDIFWSQLFWLAVVFGIVFFVFGLGVVPKVEATVDARDGKIAEDLAGAERARAQASETEAAYNARIEESRGEALKVAAAAKADSARRTEERMKAVDAEIRAKVEAAEARIRAATDSALGEIESVAAEAAQDMVSRLAGVGVTKAEAGKAVKAVMAHG